MFNYVWLVLQMVVRIIEEKGRVNFNGYHLNVNSDQQMHFYHPCNICDYTS